MMNLNYQMDLILCQIFKIISNKQLKTDETLTKIPPTYFHINRINNSSVFKIKNVYKIEF